MLKPRLLTEIIPHSPAFIQDMNTFRFQMANIFVELLANYRFFLKVPSRELTKMEDLFDRPNFLQFTHPADIDFLSMLTLTQFFQFVVQKKSSCVREEASGDVFDDLINAQVAKKIAQFEFLCETPFSGILFKQHISHITRRTRSWRTRFCSINGKTFAMHSGAGSFSSVSHSWDIQDGTTIEILRDPSLIKNMRLGPHSFPFQI